MSWRRLLLPAAVYAVILALSAVPADRFDDLDLPAAVDYLGHAVEYAMLGAALRWAVDDVRLPLVVTVLAGAVLGAADEWFQSTVPGRDPALADFLIDLAAVTVAGVGAGRVLRVRDPAGSTRHPQG